MPVWILPTVIRQRNNPTCTGEKALLQNGHRSSEHIWISIDKQSLILLMEGCVSWWVSGDCVAQGQHIFTGVSANRPFCFLMAPNRSFLIQAPSCQLANAWQVTHLHNISTGYLYVPSTGKLVNTSFLKSQQAWQEVTSNYRSSIPDYRTHRWIH